MSDPTQTQHASRELAEAVFADPDLRSRFEVTAEETANRAAVRDDFAWLSEPDRTTSPSSTP